MEHVRVSVRTGTVGPGAHMQDLTTCYRWDASVQLLCNVHNKCNICFSVPRKEGPLPASEVIPEYIKLVSCSHERHLYAVLNLGFGVRVSEKVTTKELKVCTLASAHFTE